MSLKRRRTPIATLWLAAFIAAATACESESTGPADRPDPEPDPITSVVITAPATEVAAGTTLQLTAQVLPSGSSQTVTWSSSDDGIAAVSASGLVTGTGSGTATITAASTVDPSKSDAVQVTVTCAILTPADVANGGNLPPDACYTAESPLVVNTGTLTVGEGVDIHFAPNAFLRIASGGSLNGIGTATKPITLTSVDAAGQWRGVNFDGSRSASNVLRYVTIVNGGSEGWSGAAYSRSAVLLQDDALVDIGNSTITGSGGQGITAYGGSELTFEDNTLSNNAVAAWMHPDNAGAIAGSTTFTGNTENVVRVAFGNNDVVGNEATWPALEVPYRIQTRFFIDALLTLQAGATLEYTRDASTIVRNAGAITAIGTEADPVTFTGVESLSGYWQGLRITTASTDNVFDNVILESGGSQPWTGNGDSRAMVYLEDNSKAVFTNSTFRSSGHYALWVPDGGDITGFDNNRFVGNARAMIVHPNRAGAVLPSNEIRENTEDRIRVTFGNTDVVTTDQSWEHIGVPYLVMSRTFVQAGLTVAEGVTLEFAQGASLLVDDGGSLAVEGGDPEVGGTPVLFRGAEDVAGYWQGLRIGTASTSNALSHVRIANAGSSQWFGGGNSIGALYVDADGLLAMNDVLFEKSGGLAAIVWGTVTCSNVDHGGFGLFVRTGGTVTGCPSP